MRQFLNKFGEEDLGFYLNHIANEKPTFKDLLQGFRVYIIIWQQYNETLCKNCAINRFENDRLDLCSVVRLLSHQKADKDRETIMKRMGDTLGYMDAIHAFPTRGSILVKISPTILKWLYDHDGTIIGLSSTEPTSTSPSSWNENNLVQFEKFVFGPFSQQLAFGKGYIGATRSKL